MENYFNYYTEVEEHFCRRRGTVSRVSPLDWVLIETWKNAGIPLEAVLRGIDATFDHYERRPSKTKKINGLGWCAQEVLVAAEDMKEAAVGASRQEPTSVPGLETEEIARFFLGNADKLRKAQVPTQMKPITEECAASLDALAESLKRVSPGRLEDLERHLTILEEKLLAALTMTAAETTLLGVRTEADREIAPYRAKMPAAQIDQLVKQFVHKRLFEQARIPRLSLFYM
ncbi:MAG TPA: hypothetical protein VG488_04405 [Candidatus Angelobacter sp.]|nr:hypothetical protein [Candidatus Angelobacter sp.]